MQWSTNAPPLISVSTAFFLPLTLVHTLFFYTRKFSMCACPLRLEHHSISTGDQEVSRCPGRCGRATTTMSTTTTTTPVALQAHISPQFPPFQHKNAPWDTSQPHRTRDPNELLKPRSIFCCQAGDASHAPVLRRTSSLRPWQMLRSGPGNHTQGSMQFPSNYSFVILNLNFYKHVKVIEDQGYLKRIKFTN